MSAAFEAKAGILGIGGGAPLLGMARHAKAIPASFWARKSRTLHVAPGATSTARHHGDFDNDARTLATTLERIRGKPAGPSGAAIAGPLGAPSRAEQAGVRQQIDKEVGRRGG